jgi:hypothetical protein
MIFNEVVSCVQKSFITLGFGIHIIKFFGIIYTASGVFPFIFAGVTLIVVLIMSQEKFYNIGSWRIGN